ncbi:urocortin-3-like [Megalops cyprinoides]|uniref:urocortin-3-like n=1 Tax=Megalops cyprinoides TaxID=118141 RepID=UPI0018642A45|nr:urocortin-3-like [Megalops cyprinoides]XP_036376424.1 urocortin-3-like [Megalops cyprinoides]
MMSFMRSLLVFAVLCAPTTGLCFKLYESESTLLCNNEILSEARKSELPSVPTPDERGFLYLPGDTLSSAESRQKRTFPALSSNYLTQTQLRGKMFQNSAKNDRRSKLTLSLDVPTNIMNILFDIAKAKHLRAKAEDNARLMAQIGKRK